MTRLGTVGRIVLLATAVACHARPVRGEVFVRWTQPDVPPPAALGVDTLVVPSADAALVRRAAALGYRVLLEIDAAALGPSYRPPRQAAGLIVSGAPGATTPAREKAPAAEGLRVLTTEPMAKWPHIRANWVTQHDGVLQVAGRSAQPWIETNAALLRMQPPGGRPPLLAAAWAPVTAADESQGPRTDEYLVAIAEAGSFGADLLLPLHPVLQRGILLGLPAARAAWTEILRHIEFYALGAVPRYAPVADVAVIAAEPLLWFEVLNLLARHNVPARIVSAGEPLDAFDLVLLLGDPPAGARARVAEFERTGGTVVERAEPVTDPNALALAVRRLVPPSRRAFEIWNGITVVGSVHAAPDGGPTLVTLLNYTAQPLPVQIRVAGTFEIVHYEAPGERAERLAYQHRDRHTEFVVPALRTGARIFLSAVR